MQSPPHYLHGEVNQPSLCSLYNFLAILTPPHKVGSIINPTGTAVMTIKDCSAPIPPDPILIRIAATAPMVIAQNTLMLLGGSSSPVTQMAMDKDIESPVVARKRKIRIRKRGIKIDAMGS